MVNILGPNGQPVRATVAHQEQTAKLRHLHREVADNPTNGLTPSKLARILRQATEGDIIAQSELADDILEKDAHIYAETAKRVDAVAGAEWHVKPPKEPTPAEERATELVQDMLERLDFDDMLRDMLSGLLPGFSCLEYYWEFDGRYQQPIQPTLRPQTWFMSLREDRNELRLRNQDAEGQKLKPLNWIQHRHRAKHGYLSQIGLVRVLAWPFLLRALPVRDFAQFLEIYGIPIRLGKYPSGATAEEQNTLLRAVASIGHSAAGIMPESMKVEIMNAAEGSADVFMSMINWAEGAASKAILGGTLTTNAENTGLGSNLGETQNECRKEIRDSDAKQLEQTLNRQLIDPFVKLNTTATRSPKLVLEFPEYEDMQVFSDALPKLADAGMRISVNWAHERSGIPIAEDNEPLIIGTSQQTSPSVPGLAAATLTPVTSSGDFARNPAGIMASQLAENAANPLKAWLDQIKALVATTQANGGTLGDVRDQLINMYGDLPAEEMRAVMSLAFRAAAGAGVEDVTVESGL
jgi:phage gp29-like protein